MIESKAKSSWILYLVMAALFFLSVVFNEYVDIAGIRPDILLIMLIFLSIREKAVIAICCAFAFGLLQDMILPGNVQYWGLAPLFKTLLIFAFLKLFPLISRLRGFSFQLVILASFLLYFIFYTMFYYSGFMNSFAIFYRYALPASMYTFVIYLLLNMIFPQSDQAR